MIGKMKAARLYAPGDLRIEETEIPCTPADHVLIRVKAVGICGSDPARVMKNGTYSYPTTVGHEFAGEVVEVGVDVRTVEVGDRVTIVPLVPCGKCGYCQIGEYTLCDGYSYYGSRMDGAMADYIAVRECNVVKLPSGVDYESGACTDPVSVALHAMRKAGVTAGESIAILGAGPIGLFTVQWARIFGATKVFAVDVFQEKLEIAAKVGADFVVNAKKEDPVDFVMRHTNGAGVHRVIEMAGVNHTQEQSIRMVAKMGTVAFCGISYDDLVIPKKTLDGLLRKEIRIVGSWNSSFTELPLHEWRASLHFMANRQIQCYPLISHRLPLNNAPDVFRRIWAKNEYFNKVLFIP
ncbi:MAG: galactitol-1-phosphate 5-dehydrogenase [Bacteroidota bacterium]